MHFYHEVDKSTWATRFLCFMTSTIRIFTAFAAFVILASVCSASIKESFSKTFKSSEVSALRVDANRGQIIVEATDTDVITVTWTIDYQTDDLEKVEEVREKLTYDAAVSEGVCAIVFKYGKAKGWSWPWGKSVQVEIKIETPRAVDVVANTSGGRIQVEGIAGDCDVSTSGGRIELESITGNVVAKTSGGQVDLEDITGDAIVKSSGGSIDIEDITGEVRATTTGGGISIEGGSKRIIAETTGGSIQVECPDPNLERIDLSTMGGSIRIELDPRVGGSLDLKTQGGFVSIDDSWSFSGEKERSAMRGMFGEGDSTIIGYTLGGSVRLDTI